MFVSVFWTYSKSSMSSLCRGPRPGCSTPHEASKGQSREGEKPLISDNTSFHKAQDAAGLSCCKHALLVDIRLFILWNLQVLLSRTASCDEIYFSVIPSNFCWLTSFSRSLYNSVFFFFFHRVERRRMRVFIYYLDLYSISWVKTIYTIYFFHW